MKGYDVLWQPEAEMHLARLWLWAADRQAVSEAAATADSLLQERPAERGEPLREGLRVLRIPPLRFVFEVDDVAGLARVVSVAGPRA